MNVLQVMNYAAPYRGNFMESLECLDRELRPKGGQLIYVFPARARTNAAAAWIAEMSNRGAVTYFLTGSLIGDLRVLGRAIYNHDICIVHLHFAPFWIELLTYLSTVFTNVRVIRHAHNHYSEVSTLKNRLKKMFHRLTFRNSDFIGVSQSVCEGIQRLYPENRCYAVENAIYFKRLDSWARLERAHYSMPKDCVVCLMMGFDYLRKGVDLVLDAIMALREDKDVRLMIAVATNREHVLQHIIQRVGELPGWVVLLPPRNDVASYYKLADIFISASREEGFCYALVEAAYCERVIVASKIPAQGDLQVPNVFWFEPEDAQDLKVKLANAVARKEHFEHEIHQAKCEVLRLYDVTGWAHRILGVYERVLKG